VLREQGRAEEAWARVSDAARVFRASGQHGELAVCEHDLAVLLHDAGRLAEATAALRTVQPRLRPAGLCAVATCELNLGIARHEAGDIDGAVRAYDRAHRAFMATGRETEALICEQNRATALAGSEPDEAAARAGSAPDRASLGAHGPADAARGKVAAALDGARQTLFREEALEYQAKGADPVSGLLRVDSGRVRWGFWLLLAFLGAAIVLAGLVRVESSATGAARVDLTRRSFVGLLPAVIVPDLETARRLEVRVDGEDGGATLPALLVAVKAAAPDVLEGAGLPAPRQPSILVEGTLVDGAGALPAGAEVGGRVRVVLRSESLLSVFGQRAGRSRGGGGR
jgi:hypothetical protein